MGEISPIECQQHDAEDAGAPERDERDEALDRHLSEAAAAAAEAQRVMAAIRRELRYPLAASTRLARERDHD